MSEERFDRVDLRLDRLEAGLDRLEVGQEQLRADLGRHATRLDSRIDDLDRHMHVLHEEVIARIAAIPEYSGPSKADFADLKETIERRLDPLEATVRQHSADIERLKQRRR